MRGAQVVAGTRASELMVATKSSHRDLVTDVDGRAEQAIVEYLRTHRPSDPILAEETGAQAGKGPVRWIVDPIDGTANFVRGRPDFAIAIAAEVEGRVAVGAIVKPATGEWIACDEAGVLAAGGRPPTTSWTRNLNEALVSVSVSISETRRPLTLSTLTRLLPEIQDFRRSGSTSCDFSAVATGHLDAYIGIGSNEWDIAAGWAVVNAAGGSCLRFPVQGGHEAFVLGSPYIVEDLAGLVTDQAQKFAAAQAFPLGPPRPRTGRQAAEAPAFPAPRPPGVRHGR